MSLRRFSFSFISSISVSIVSCAVLLCACSPTFHSTRESTVPLADEGGASVERVSLKYSNLFLLRGRSTGSVVLVDAGSPSDIDRITNALAKMGMRPSDVKAVVLTHGHGDHAGMGLFFQKQGVKIIVGRGDELQTTVGKNDEMTPTSAFAVVLKPFVKLDYDPFTPDLLVDTTLDLAPYGLPGVTVKHMPGHTRGSLVVFTGRDEAVVGDMMLGGIWGGMFHEQAAGEHYYQLNRAENRCNVQALLDDGIDVFHLGHGGSVNRDAVMQWRRSWPDPMTCPARADR